MEPEYRSMAGSSRVNDHTSQIFQEMKSQKFDNIRFSSYRTACKLRFVQKKLYCKWEEKTSCLIYYFKPLIATESYGHTISQCKVYKPDRVTQERNVKHNNWQGPNEKWVYGLTVINMVSGILGNFLVWKLSRIWQI